VPEPKRALILAGGGVKVAFQAGVLQVLLDEAEGLAFDHVDGASGGSLNLAMLCQGMSGRRIADNWRRFDPLRITEPNPKFLVGESIARLGRFRENGFTDWGLDFDAIRESQLDAIFNIYDFSRHELLLVRPAEMSADMLCACICLPMWFPPVPKAGDLLIDPVFITDANLEDAIHRGATELWVIWTVSRRGRWRGGFVNHYFQIIENAAYGNFKRTLKRIDESNRAHAEGRHAEFPHPVDVKQLSAEVPVHYLVNVRSAPFRRAVDLGVKAARAWLRSEGVALRPPPAPAPPTRPSRVRFTEVMTGEVALGERDPRRGAQAGGRSPLRFKLTIHVDDLGTFLADARHQAAATGYVESAALGGRRVVSQGWFNLFTIDGDPHTRHMRYRLLFRDGAGAPVTLVGVKDVHDDPGHDAWADTTTLYATIVSGHVPPGGGDEDVIAAGILHILPQAFARQLTTFRGAGPGPFGDLTAVARFGEAFLGSLFSVYGRRLIRGG
jgi:predicted acylesterase/phospholipase RssA